jgi:hypothetical protein
LLANSVRAAQELGFTGIGHLAKPIDDDLFLTEITRLLDVPQDIIDNKSSLPLIDIITGLAHNQFCAFISRFTICVPARRCRLKPWHAGVTPPWAFWGPTSSSACWSMKASFPC